MRTIVDNHDIDMELIRYSGEERVSGIVRVVGGCNAYKVDREAKVVTSK